MNLAPLRTLIRRQALSRGFPDPIELLEKLGRFSEPSEVSYPVELLRAGAAMHIRGLYNSAIVQYNLDWVWPYWINRQFDPADESFVPRAFSLTHINLTHRNWVAVGLPDIPAYPLVDPAGMLTPYWDGWSIDVWACDVHGHWYAMDKARAVEQRVEIADGLAVVTTLAYRDFTITTRVDAAYEGDQAVCRLRCNVDGEACVAIALAVRPANPEGVAFIHAIERQRGEPALEVDEVPVHFEREPDAWLYSDYRQGDVFHQLGNDAHHGSGRSCEHGMATAAAVFRFQPDAARTAGCSLPLIKPAQAGAHPPRTEWQQALASASRFRIPDARFQYLTDVALHTLVLLAPGEVYPGSYTYKRFWFRDATYMVSALLAVGLVDRARKVLDHFIHRQLPSGYFQSQEGEWDSNGQVLWIFGHYFSVTGERPGRELLERLVRGGKWIQEKRRQQRPTHQHPGLLPPGFSAEHLGPNDYYYWDDFWSVAGLRSLAAVCGRCGDQRNERRFQEEARDLMQVIDDSLLRAAERNQRAAIPAAPSRRLDSAVIGSVVASYPLRLLEPDDPRLRDTLDFLKEHCLVEGAFYQEMIHSGINAYLTLHLAQAALRSGDDDWFRLVQAVADVATAAGQWPEAINPRTGGGCMGDGQHGWAVAEWLLMIRSLFIREENGTLVLASGIPDHWLAPGREVACRASPVEGGVVSVEVLPGHDQIEVRWDAHWHGRPQAVEIRLPGYPSCSSTQPSGSVTLERKTPCAS